MGEARPGVSKTEVLGILVLVFAATVLLGTSWRKWPDPLIDFGRELYLPWQINEGAVLYRDIDANYGPLSHYFNALIFRVFGTGFMQLVWANLFIYGCLLTLLYRIVRLAAGPGGAFVASLGFIGVFSFNQLSGVGNYNFVSPYAHETTHGFLLLMVLIWLWVAWLREPRLARSALIGLVLGAILLLKVEIIFTAAAVSVAALTLAVLGRSRVGIAGRSFAHLGTVVVAGLVPPTLATLVLYRTGRFEPLQAFLWANVGWTGLVLFPDIAKDPIQTSILGIDAVPENLRRLATAGFLALAGPLLLALASRLTDRTRKWIALLAASTMALLAIRLSAIVPWLAVGRAFPAALAALGIVWLFSARGDAESLDRGSARCLLWTAAAAFLARMVLNPGISHYGYCQAALAGVVTILGVWVECPRVVGLEGRARSIYLFVLAVFLAGGLVRIQTVSQQMYALKTEPVGEGTDQFYAYDRRVNPTGFLVEDARRTLTAQSDSGRLFVVPEGLMVNYLTRRPTPTHVYTFNAYWLKWTPSVLADLDARPPAWVLLISRDLREYGIGRFGESETHGGPIVGWIARHYAPVRGVGGNPFTPGEFGTLLLAPRTRTPNLGLTPKAPGA